MSTSALTSVPGPRKRPSEKGPSTIQTVREAMRHLSPLDVRLLQWMGRYPYVAAEHLAVAVARWTSIGTVYRHLALLEGDGLIEWVSSASLGKGQKRLYHLSNTGLHVVAACEHASAVSLARVWQTDEHGLLSL